MDNRVKFWQELLNVGHIFTEYNQRDDQGKVGRSERNTTDHILHEMNKDTGTFLYYT